MEEVATALSKVYPIERWKTLRPTTQWVSFTRVSCGTIRRAVLNEPTERLGTNDAMLLFSARLEELVAKEVRSDSTDQASDLIV